MKKEFICKHCKKHFFAYTYPNNPKRKENINYCSYSCRSKDMDIGWSKKIWYNRGQIENTLKKYIISKNRYVTKEELIKDLHISSKTLNHFNISVLDMNKQCGMSKPKSMFEFIIKNYFKNRFEDFEEEKTFDECKSPKGYNLYFDIYLKEHNILIECDGPQHKSENEYRYDAYRIMCDNIKNKFCIDNDIKIIRIPYTKNVTDSYIEKYFSL